MILTSTGRLIVYRMHTPKWAVAPLSGAGAAAHGGRLNRPGTAALYLSLDAPTAIAEYQQLSVLMPPGTLVSYELEVNPVADFLGGYERSKWSIGWQSLNCDWRALWFDQRVEPPSWALADETLAAGGKGVMFASTVRPGGVNLVLYVDTLGAMDVLNVYDPAGALPKNQDSWR